MTSRTPIETKRAAAELASELGLQRAADTLGMSVSRLCEWRLEVEAQTGERLPRRTHLRGRSGGGKLNLVQRHELRERRGRGVSWGVLARIYGVSEATCRRAAGAMR